VAARTKNFPAKRILVTPSRSEISAMSRSQMPHQNQQSPTKTSRVWFSDQEIVNQESSHSLPGGHELITYIQGNLPTTRQNTPSPSWYVRKTQ
jgi:hypothetical protein